MQSLWSRVIRHAAWTGICLAVIGHLLARAFLFAHKMYAGGAYAPENERVLWQTPVVMAGFGICLTVGLDLLLGFIRRPVRIETSAQPPA